MATYPDAPAHRRVSRRHRPRRVNRRRTPANAVSVANGVSLDDAEDAELDFTAGPLEGLKLIGFGIWETRGGARRNVTFPARRYAVSGDRRLFYSSRS